MTREINKFFFPINFFNFNGKKAIFPVKIEKTDGKK